MAVRGLRASYPASARRLKPIAALRAATIAAMIHHARVQSQETTCVASRAPTSANGRANTEWPMRTNEA